MEVTTEADCSHDEKQVIGTFDFFVFSLPFWAVQNGSSGRSYVLLLMFSFFLRKISELPWLIAVKLCHMIAKLIEINNPGPKIWGPLPQQNLGALTPTKFGAKT